MNYLDLFAGIGGFPLGAYNAGWRFERHYFSEVDPWCCKLYSKRFPDAIPLGDIRKIDGQTLIANCERMGREKGTGESIRSIQQEAIRQDSGDIRPEGWIITGGFPCQDISVAGKGAGIVGARSGLWFEYARLIGEIRPRYAIMENVGALTRRGLDRVLGNLAEIGYDAEWSDIRASDVGAPHKRERIWIVAYPGDGGQRELLQQVRQRRGDTKADTWSDGKTRSIPGRACGGWWSVEPPVGRVVNGISRRVDRLRGLGNSIVPQIAEMIFRGIEDREPEFLRGR